MGSIGGLLGTAGGANGSGFSGPQGAPILQPTTVAQAQTAYQGNQDALKQQQALLTALQGQGGLQNQSNVYGQLQDIAAGRGPNPAQAMLAQATRANTANQAALMAGQRGASQNVGLIARQAAQQGGANQQNAAGQSATMQAQQSLNALGQAGNMANTMANQQITGTGAVTTAQQNEQSNLLNAIAQQNNANVGMQSNINQANAGLAGGMMSGQQNMIGNITGGAGAFLNSLAEGGEVEKIHAAGGWTGQSVDYNNQDPVFQTSPTASGATDMSTVGPQTQASPMSPAIPTAPVAPSAPASPAAPSVNAPASGVGKFLKSFSNSSGSPQAPGQSYYASGQAGKDFGTGLGNALKSLYSGSSSSPAPAQSQVSPSEAKLQDQLLQTGNYTGGQEQTPASNDMQDGGNQAAKGGRVPALVSPGERYLSPKEVKKVEKGEKSPMKAGEKIPGKPKVPGAVNSYVNDFVKKDLQEGGVVLPRSVTQSKHPHWAAHKFMLELNTKKRHAKKGSK